MRFASWITILAILGASAWASAATPTANVDSCGIEWNQVQALPDFADQLVRWQALAPKCAKSGIYEVRLAGLLTLAGRYDEAREAVRSGLALDTPFRKELLGARAAISLNTMQLADAQKQYQALISSYPDYFDGYCGMGALRLMERKFPEAVDYSPLFKNMSGNIQLHRLGLIRYRDLSRICASCQLRHKYSACDSAE